jgi:hypothetical protein
MLRHRAITVLLVAGLAVGSTACAVGGYPYRDRGRSDRYDWVERQRAFDAGYRAGLEAGRRDAYRRARYDPGRWGVEGTRDFRSGFRRGYDDGFRGLRSGRR